MFNNTSFCMACFEKKEVKEEDEEEDEEEKDEDKDETIRWLTMENNIACNKHCIIGDGNIDYDEWFDYCDLSEEDLKKYKKWLSYEEEEKEVKKEEEEEEVNCSRCMKSYIYTERNIEEKLPLRTSCDECLAWDKYFEDKNNDYDRWMQKKYPNWKNMCRRERKNLTPPSSDEDV